MQSPEAAYHQGKADVARAVAAILRGDGVDDDRVATAQAARYYRLGDAPAAEGELVAVVGVLQQLGDYLQAVPPQREGPRTRYKLRCPGSSCRKYGSGWRGHWGSAGRSRRNDVDTKRLTELMQLVAGITPGPWNSQYLYRLLRYGRVNDGSWADELLPGTCSAVPGEGDADFIAAAPTVVPELLDEVVALRNRLELAEVRVIALAREVPGLLERLADEDSRPSPEDKEQACVWATRLRGLKQQEDVG